MREKRISSRLQFIEEAKRQKEIKKIIQKPKPKPTIKKDEAQDKETENDKS